VVRALDSHPGHGLSGGEARRRLLARGPNELVAARARPWWKMLARQFTDLMIVVLVGAAVISGLIGELRDTLVIVVIVLLNAAVGFVQEFRAERALAALAQLVPASARVRRGGADRHIPVREVVPGDLVLLEAGSLVPADVRLLSAHGHLTVDESPLTGEAHPVEKSPLRLIDPALPVVEQSNMVFKGTLVSGGRAMGVAVATGMATQLGRTARLLAGEQAGTTPLKRRMDAFGRRLALFVLGICAVIFGAGLLRGEPTLLMFLTAVSLAVAAIPEAFPAVLTVTLAVGARKLAAAGALIRNLPAAETLGSVTFICADKTGTLTSGRMAVSAVWVDGEWQPLSAAPGDSPLGELGRAVALNSNVAPVAGADRPPDAGPVAGRGASTEEALAEAAGAAGFHRQELERAWPRLAEVPFDSVHKRMITLHRSASEGGGTVAYVKGAPEQVLGACGEDAQGTAATAAARRAEDGERVLAFAWRMVDADSVGAGSGAIPDSGYRLLGLVALTDPPRPEAAAAVAECRRAGIVPVMITGDHPDTARAIAMHLGIAAPGDPVLTGRQLAALTDAALAERVRRVTVYARMAPEQKIRIVRALQADGECVAMTGDGVNDAPALKAAQIGVAMGQRGTDVAREAAGMVLLDDNFATIVAAVREGRRIFDNIRKFIRYSLTSNAGEIWTLFLAPFLGLPLPLLPTHILWVNLVTDGLPGLALAAEPEERGVMRRPPRPPGEGIFARGMWQHVLFVGLLIGGLSILTQAWAIGAGEEDRARTMVFTVLTFCQLAHAMAIRSERDCLFTIGIGSNPLLLAAVLATVGLQVAVIYLPVGNTLLHTVPLSAGEMAFCLLLPGVVFLAVEAEKWVLRRFGLYGERSDRGVAA